MGTLRAPTAMALYRAMRIGDDAKARAGVLAGDTRAHRSGDTWVCSPEQDAALRLWVAKVKVMQHPGSVNPRLKHGHEDVQYGGLVRASGRFRGWMGSPDAKRADGRIPYESTERAERHGRVRCQALRGIEITDQGTIEIAGLGELHVVGGLRQRRGAVIRELSIQENSREGRNGPETGSVEREFVIVMTLNIERNASATGPAPQRAPHEARVDRNGVKTERSRDDGECASHERQSRWKRRKGRRHKQGSAHAAHSGKDGRPKGRSGSKGRNREWDGERY